MARASTINSRPTSPSPNPTISRTASSAIIEPMTPASAPNIPASAQAGTEPAGGGSGNRQRYDVIIDYPDRADTGGRQIHQQRRAEATGPDYQHARALEHRLPGSADLAQHDVARIALEFVRRQHVCTVIMPFFMRDLLPKT